MYQRLLAARTYRSGSMTLRQVHFAVTDLELHSSFVPGGPETVFERERAVAARTLVMQPLPEDRFLACFSHIFAGGYSAGYFSYKVRARRGQGQGQGQGQSRGGAALLMLRWASLLAVRRASPVPLARRSSGCVPVPVRVTLCAVGRGVERRRVLGL
jgi:hypothetical protein